MNKIPESIRFIISGSFSHGRFITLIPNSIRVVSPPVNSVEKSSRNFF